MPYSEYAICCIFDYKYEDLKDPDGEDISKLHPDAHLVASKILEIEGIEVASAVTG